MARPPVAARKPPAPPDKVVESGMDVIAKPIRQLGRDVVSGGQQLFDQAKAASDVVQSGFQKVKKFLTGK